MKKEKTENIAKEEVKNSSVKNNVSKKQNTNNTDNTENEEYVDKYVKNRGYVYDAQYIPENINVETYKTNDGENHSVLEIKVPYINMDCDAGKECNLEIEDIYKGFVNEFKACSDNKNSYIKSSYETFITSNIISTVITVERGKEENVTNEYIAYNFDAITGTKLSYDQVYGIAGITDVSECIKDNIDSFDVYDEYLQVNPNESKDAVETKKENVENCKKQIFTNYQQDLINNKLVYYLDRNLKLNIKMKIFLPEDSKEEIHEYEKIVTINT